MKTLEDYGLVFQLSRAGIKQEKHKQRMRQIRQQLLQNPIVQELTKIIGMDPWHADRKRNTWEVYWHRDQCDDYTVTVKSKKGKLIIEADYDLNVYYSGTLPSKLKEIRNKFPDMAMRGEYYWPRDP